MPRSHWRSYPGYTRILWLGMVVWALLSTAALSSQEIPAGTILPIRLDKTLDAKKNKPRQAVRARIMQDVTLDQRSRIRAGAQVVGHVVEAESTPSGSRLVLIFDRVVTHGRALPVTTNLRAIASMQEVYEAQLPTNAWDDYGTSTSDWNTVQVGGEVVYRGSGEVISGSEVVGSSSDSGEVRARVRSSTGGCRGAVAGNDKVQSLWIFSTSACGVYGFSALSIAHAGRTNPLGQIVLASTRNVHVNSGSGLLLRVDPSER